ncbi:hypothetical protein GCM10009779_61240 [Polymorphospora rubra]|uniref:Uncharacterized protein n=2 Tax=Polymorphospora rubra TaxID=338584 RepID=A0A810MUI3_9ACTN|nr:hypothetical protein Prubr_18870 [Polymorphospora rubra]
MGFDLVVLAVDPGATDAEIRATADRCRGLHHPKGDPDERIVGFYEALRARYPDFPPHDRDSPWMATPLDVGIDHVSMCLGFGERRDPALQLIDELAQRHELTIYDHQDDEVARPADVRTPLDPAILTLIDELRP